MDQKPKSKVNQPWEGDNVNVDRVKAAELLSVDVDDTNTKTDCVPLLPAIPLRRKLRRGSYNTWITSHFCRKECVNFIQSPEKHEKLDPECHCGRKRSEHDTLNSDSDLTTWKTDTCTSKRGTDAYGEVQFQGTGSQNRSPYVRLSDDTDAGRILDLMLIQWQLKVPNLVISVTGGAKSFVLNHHLEAVFRRGLMKAAKSTGAWIITGGTKNGVMKHVGEAVKEHQLMPGTKVKVIGIASWAQILNKKALVEEKEGEGRYPAVYDVLPSSPKHCAQLDPNHTHFILVDDGSHNSNHWGVEINLRSRVEEAIMKQKTDSRSEEGSIGVPVVLLVLEGGPNTIKTTCEAIQKKIPVVIIDGSGRAASLLAFAYRVIGKNISKVDRTYENEIKGKLREICKESEIDFYYGMVNDILKDETMVSVYRLDDGISQDIDFAILKALLKTNRSSKSVKLKLALAWNRIDLAKSDIFTENPLWTTEELSGPTLTALLDDKPDFVELFLKSGLVMKEFLNDEHLLMLYNATVDDMEIIIHTRENNPFNMQMVRKTIADLMGGIDVMATESTPFLDVLIWSVLCNRQELARVLWENCVHPIAAALMACKLLRSLAKKNNSHETNAEDLLKHAMKFEKRAIGVLDQCVKAKETYCQTLHVRKLVHFGDSTCLDLAASSKSENFISHPVCQRSLSRVWMGAMTMNNSYIKVVLCMFVPFLIPLVLAFDNVDDKIGSPSSSNEEYSNIHEEDGERGVISDPEKRKVLEKVSCFYSAPITKYVGNVISNMIFIVSYAYVVMMNFPKFDRTKALGGISPVEIFLYVWVFSIVIEECRQIGTETTKNFLKKVRMYLGDPWNWNSIDILSIAVFVMAFVLRFVAHDSIFRVAHVILTVGLVLFIVRFLQVFFLNRHLGPRLVMIGKMMKDLMHFAFILLVFLIAYGISLQAVMFPGPGQYARNNTWKSILGVLELPYWQMYGELFLDEIKGEKPDEFGKVSPVGQWLSPLLLALFMLVANVLLLNLLIAIFSNTFQGIQDASDKVWKLQRYDLVYEYDNRPLLPPPLIIISHVFLLLRGSLKSSSMKRTLTDAENEQFDNWEFQAAKFYTHEKQKQTSAKMDQSLLNQLEQRIERIATNCDVSRLEGKVDIILRLLEGTDKIALPNAYVSSLGFMHYKARSSPYPGSGITRFQVPDDKIDWNVSFPDYDPKEYTAPVVLSKPHWADPDLISMAVLGRPKLRYNAVDRTFNVDRTSYIGTYNVKDGLPMNPMGRTGVKGRGLLGRFGPNHAADPVVTRWRQTSAGVMVEGGQKVLEFVAILRKDNNQWAIPGGMVEPGGTVSQTLKSEFGEEALAQMDVSPEERKRIGKQIDHLFQHGDEVYRGYVDDPRNTDNAWMETIAVNFHDDHGEMFSHFNLQAGDDAAAVKWQRVSGNIPLYASHASILEKVAKLRGAAF